MNLCELDAVGTVAGGLTAKKVGELTFSVVRKYVDDIILVTEQELVPCQAALLIIWEYYAKQHICVLSLKS